MSESELCLIIKRDDVEMFRFYPGRITGSMAREFRAHFGLSTNAAQYEFSSPAIRDVDSWVKLVWLADRMGAHTLTPDAVEALLGTAGNIEEHWSWEEVIPTTEDVPEALEAVDPEA
jgi:hypothetical protein